MLTLPFYLSLQMREMLPTWDLISTWPITASHKWWTKYTKITSAKWCGRCNNITSLRSSLSFFCTLVCSYSWAFSGKVKENNGSKRLQKDISGLHLGPTTTSESYVICAQYGAKNKDTEYTALWLKQPFIRSARWRRAWEQSLLTEAELYLLLSKFISCLRSIPSIWKIDEVQ